MKVKIIGFLGAIFLRLLSASLRWQVVNAERDGEHWSHGEPTILAVWHGDQLLGPWAYFTPGRALSDQPRDMTVLVSQHGDGRILAAMLDNLRIKNVPGSSTRGGVRALVQMKKAVLAGSHTAITPDGPKGPIYEVKSGILALSAMSGAPIRPITFVYESSWQLSSWDKTCIPKPFSRAALVFGDDIRVPKKSSKDELELYGKQLKSELERIKVEAKELIAQR